MRIKAHSILIWSIASAVKKFRSVGLQDSLDQCQSFFLVKYPDQELPAGDRPRVFHFSHQKPPNGQTSTLLKFSIIFLPVQLLLRFAINFNVAIYLILIRWTAVGTLFEYYWKRFCICPAATRVKDVRSVSNEFWISESAKWETRHS